MKRKIYEDLLKWKNTESKIPLMVVGARQIGKTYIINEFCKKEFKKYIYINLLETPEIVSIFSRDINIMEKFKRMEIFLDTKIDIENTVIFFDEVQESEDIISALKFFCESEEKFKIICAGSLLGVKINRFKKSFPVGKVRILNMASMDFEEFLWAKGYDDSTVEDMLEHMRTLKPFNEVEMAVYSELFLDYCILGGMPAVVREFVEKGTFEGSLEVQRQLIADYKEDIRKYAEGMDQTRILNAVSYTHLTLPTIA